MQSVERRRSKEGREREVRREVQEGTDQSRDAARTRTGEGGGKLDKTLEVSWERREGISVTHTVPPPPTPSRYFARHIPGIPNPAPSSTMFGAAGSAFRIPDVCRYVNESTAENHSLVPAQAVPENSGDISVSGRVVDTVIFEGGEVGVGV